jgi:hypothetical protein
LKLSISEHEHPLPLFSPVDLLIIFEGLRENSDDVPKGKPLAFKQPMGALICFNPQHRHSRHAAFSDVRFRRKKEHHEGRYVIEAFEVFFGIDLHQSQVAKNGME